MKIKQTNFGLRITIPEGKYNSEFSYDVRQLAILNKGLEWHPLIYDLMREEKAITSNLILRLFSMENFFKSLENNPKPWKMYDVWEEHNKADFNEYYHDGIRDMLEEIDGIARKYWDNGINYGYSCCM